MGAQGTKGPRRVELPGFTHNSKKTTALYKIKLYLNKSLECLTILSSKKEPSVDSKGHIIYFFIPPA